MNLRMTVSVVAILLLAGSARAVTYRADANVWKADEPSTLGPAGGAEPNETFTTWTFGANVRVSQGGQQLWPDIVRFGGGKLCASWMDDRTGTYKIYSSVSTDGGITWLADQRVDDSPAGVMARFVTLHWLGLADVCAVWEDVRAGSTWNVYYSRGVWNGGMNRIDWSPSLRVNTTGGTTDSGSYMHPSVAVDAARIFVAWTDWRDGVFYQVYSRASTDEGITWGAETRVSDNIGYQPVAGDPSLFVDSSGPTDPRPIVCVWNDWRGYAPGGRYPNVAFARSTDAGASWTTNVIVNDVTDYYQQVSKHVIAIPPASGAISVGWYNDDFAGQPEMRVSRSIDHGVTWGASRAVSDPVTGCGVSVALALGIDDDILTSWMGYVNDWNVYFRASDDAGETWFPILRADDDATGGASYSPNLATLPDGSPMVVMQDSRPGYGPYCAWVAPGHRAGSSGVEEMDGSADGALRIYPNPAHGKTRIRWSLPTADPGEVRILDASGRLVYRRSVSGPGGIVWNTSSPAGVYFVTLADGARMHRSKAILLP